MTPVCIPGTPATLFLPCCSSTPPVPGSRWRRGGSFHVEDGALPQWRADVVQVDAQQDQYGVEGKAETKGPDAAAAQGEAQPVDQPAGGDRGVSSGLRVFFNCVISVFPPRVYGGLSWV